MNGNAKLAVVPCVVVIPWNPCVRRALRAKPERFSAVSDEVAGAEIGAGGAYFGVFISKLIKPLHAHIFKYAEGSRDHGDGDERVTQFRPRGAKLRYIYGTDDIHAVLDKRAFAPA